MSRLVRWGAASLVLCLGAGSSPAQAAKPRRPPPPPPSGWVIDGGAVRFEPLDAAHPLGVEGVGDYRGALEIRRSPGGVAVVNDLGLEEYLLGISEVPVSWPAEAQKAQAIAARTYALYSAGLTVATAHRAVGADICATDACQVYTGLEKERRPGSEAWAAAVQATAGQVLLYKGAPILAKYSSSNGGRTVAGGKPYLRSVADADDARSPLHRWRSELPLGAVRGALGVGHEVALARREGDSVVLRESDADGAPESVVAALDFRARLNEALAPPAGLPRAVPSIQFDPQVDAGAGLLVLEGRGWGHGIGLSQYGALGKALNGRKASEILAFYYGGLKPETVPPDQLPSSIRVAVELGRAQAVVAAAGGRFRVLDGAGQVVVPVATGAWTVAPGPKSSVRLVPPPEQFAPVAVEAVVAPAPVGVPVQLTLRLSGPALVTLRATPPAGVPQTVGPVTVDGGEVTQALPPATVPGAYEVVVEVDGGRDRSSAIPVTIPVTTDLPALSPDRATAASAPGTLARPLDPPVAVAATLLALVALLVRRERRRARAGPTDAVPTGAGGAGAE